MAEISATRPAPLSRVWSGSRIIAENVEGADLSDVLELDADSSAWWLLARDAPDTERKLHQVAAELDLDEFAVRDLVASDDRAKFEELGQARIAVLGAANLDRAKSLVTLCPVSVIVTDRILICSTEPSEDFRPAPALAGKGSWLAAGGTEAALQIVVAAVVESYEAVVAWLQEGSDQLATALFEERPLSKDEQLWAFRLRTALSRLRRMTDPMRTVLSALADSLPDGLPPATRSVLERHWRLLAERHERVANAADALREALASAFDTSLALADVRLNSIMKKLTGWAAVIAVPTLVTSFVGMNVRFPLAGSGAGFWLYFMIMIASAGVLYVIFRRLDWI